MDDIRKEVAEAVKEALGETMPGRYLDVSRIPLICQNIDGIHTSLKDLNNKLDNKYVSNESFFPVKLLVYGFAGMILVAVVAALIGLVVFK